MPLGLSPTAIASAALVGASSIPVADRNDRRQAVRLYNGGPDPAYVAYGATAVASRGWPLPSGAQLVETTYVGQLAAVTGASGLTANLFRVDTG